MGIDANEDLIDSLSSVRGANHYFVHSVSEFEQRLDDEFEYMVTPLVFDLSLKVESSAYEIAEVYGSPGEEVENGEVMNVTTLFPSPKEDGETRGGVVLLKLEKKGSAEGTGEIGLEAGWVERDGTEGNEVLQVSVPEEPVFDNSGIRKAVLLARYGREMRDWIEMVRSGESRREGKDDWVGSGERERWEQESVPLTLPEGYEDRFDNIRSYIEAEMEGLEDDSLGQEVETVERVLKHA
jgi:Ca-activated chloride channel family protein